MNNDFFIPAVFGGILGAMATQVVTLIVWLYRRPYLEIEFLNCPDEGFVVEDVLGYDGSGNPVGKFKYLRLKIKNNGNTTASGVAAMIWQIKSIKPVCWSFCEEIIDLSGSHGMGKTFDIPPKTSRFIDLVYAKYEKTTTKLIVCSESGTAKLYRKNLTGTILFEIFVTAKNADTISNYAKVCFDGTAEHLSIV